MGNTSVMDMTSLAFLCNLLGGKFLNLYINLHYKYIAFHQHYEFDIIKQTFSWNCPNYYSPMVCVREFMTHGPFQVLATHLYSSPWNHGTFSLRLSIAAHKSRTVNSTHSLKRLLNCMSIQVALPRPFYKWQPSWHHGLNRGATSIAKF